MTTTEEQTPPPEAPAHLPITPHASKVVRKTGVLHLPTGWCVDDLALERLAHVLLDAPPHVSGIVALGGDLPPGASFRTYAEHLALLPRSSLSESDRTFIFGAVYARPSVAVVGTHHGLEVDLGKRVLLVDHGTHAHDPQRVSAELLPASASARSPFPWRPVVAFVMGSPGPDGATVDRPGGLARLVDALVLLDVEARILLAAGSLPSDVASAATRPAVASPASLDQMAPELIVPLDAAGRALAAAWAIGRRNVHLLAADEVAALVRLEPPECAAAVRRRVAVVPPLDMDQVRVLDGEQPVALRTWSVPVPVPVAEVPVPVAEVPVADVPVPVVEVPVPVVTVPVVDVPVPEADVPEVPVVEVAVPVAEVPVAEVPEADVPVADVPVVEVPVAEVPVVEVPVVEVPVAEVVVAEVPVVEVPVVEVPVVEVPVAEVVVAEVPVVEVPVVEVPVVEVPVAEVPVVGVPVVEVPVAEVPVVEVPTADATVPGVARSEVAVPDPVTHEPRDQAGTGRDHRRRPRRQLRVVQLTGLLDTAGVDRARVLAEQIVATGDWLTSHNVRDEVPADAVDADVVLVHGCSRAQAVHDLVEHRRMQGRATIIDILVADLDRTRTRLRPVVARLVQQGGVAVLASAVMRSRVDVGDAAVRTIVSPRSPSALHALDEARRTKPAPGAAPRIGFTIGGGAAAGGADDAVAAALERLVVENGSQVAAIDVVGHGVQVPDVIAGSRQVHRVAPQLLGPAHLAAMAVHLWAPSPSEIAISGQIGPLLDAALVDTATLVTPQLASVLALLGLPTDPWLLVEGKGAGAWTAALRRVLDDPVELARAGRRAGRAARAQFGHAALSDNLHELLGRAATRDRGATS